MEPRDVHPKLAMESIVRGVATLQERALQAARIGLTAQQATVAIALHEFGALSVQRLASRLEINQSAMTRLIDRLEHKELAARATSSVDGRVVEVALTPAGAAAAAAARTVIEDLKSALLEEIDPGDLETFGRVLEQMRSTVARRISTQTPQ